MKVTVAATQMTCSWEIEENITKAKKIYLQSFRKWFKKSRKMG